jgi:cell division transport system permease protein
MVTAVFQGLFASLMAILMLVGILYVVRREFSQLFEVFRLDLLLWVVAIVVAAGLAICLLSTWLSVYRLVRLTKDELYY